MTDERFVYNKDIKDRKRAAYGARAKKGGSRSRRCSLPSDNLSEAQRRKLNSSVFSIKINQPMDYALLKTLAPTLQFLYLSHLIDEHKARRVDLCGMLGVAPCTFYRLQQGLSGKLAWKYKKKKPAPEWEAFMAAGYQGEATTPTIAAHDAAGGRDSAGCSSAVSSPVVLSESVTVRCTASHALDSLMRLIDDPEREYTFTVSFQS